MLASVVVVREIIALALVVLALAVLLGLVVLLYRRRYFSGGLDSTPGFTLSDLVKMHKDGQLSDEEYERMRRTVIGMEAGTRAESGDGQGRQAGA